jgi:hypothetical protein
MVGYSVYIHLIFIKNKATYYNELIPCGKVIFQFGQLWQWNYFGTAHVFLLLEGYSAASTCPWLFVEDMDRLFDSFNSVKCAARGKTLHSPLNDKSPHIGHWTKASMGIKGWILFKDGKCAFKKLTPSQNGWIIDIIITQVFNILCHNMNNICMNSCSQEEIGPSHLSITHSMWHTYLYQKITLHGLTWTTASSLGRGQLVDGDTILCCPWIDLE